MKVFELARLHLSLFSNSRHLLISKMQTLHFFSLLLLSKLSEAAIILPTGIPNVLPDNVVPNPQTTTAPRLNARQNVGVTSMWSEFKTSIGDANAYLGTIYATDIQYLTMGKAPTTTVSCPSLFTDHNTEDFFQRRHHVSDILSVDSKEHELRSYTGYQNHRSGSCNSDNSE